MGKFAMLDAETEFFKACGRGNLEKVKILLEQGRVSIHASEDWGLRWASYRGHYDVVKFLIAKGSNIDANNYEALRLAIEKKHYKIIKFLILTGGSVISNEILNLARKKSLFLFLFVKYFSFLSRNP